MTTSRPTRSARPGPESSRSSGRTGRRLRRRGSGPGSSSPRASGDYWLFELLLDDRRRVVNADQVEASRAEVDELVRRAGADDEDVPIADLQVLTVRGEPSSPRADDPRLRVRVPVEPRALARLVVDEKQRDAGAIAVAFEAQRPVPRTSLLVGSQDAVQAQASPAGAGRPSPAYSVARSPSCGGSIVMFGSSRSSQRG